MSQTNGMLRVAKRIGIAMLILGIALSAISCGQDGKIYGDVVWDPTYLYYTIGGGFPSTGLTYGTSYQIQTGTWSYQYYIQYGIYYYPGGGTSPTSYYYGTYTVTAEPGSFPFQNGSDISFELYCSYSGMAKYGSVSSLVPSANGSAPSLTPQLGTQTWTENGLRITVTNSMAKMTPEQLAKMNQVIRK